VVSLVFIKEKLLIYSNFFFSELNILFEEKFLSARRSAQFVDLLGYFSVQENRSAADKTAEASPLMAGYATRAVSMLRIQNRILASHANSAIYTALAQLVDFGGFFLESDPCLVCNNPEVPFATLKLANLKVDTKYTTREVLTFLLLLNPKCSNIRQLIAGNETKIRKFVLTCNS
jgi:hypothetical protein